MSFKAVWVPGCGIRLSTTAPPVGIRLMMRAGRLHYGMHPYHKNTSIAESVYAPQLDVCFSLDSGGSGCAVYKSELPKAPTFADIQHYLIVDVDFYFSRINYIKVVSLVT